MSFISMLRTLILTGMVFFVSLPFSSADLPSSDFSLLDLVQKPLLKKLYHKHGWGLLNMKEADGAYGANVSFEQGETDKWYIEEQRYAVDQVEAGIDTGRPQEVFDAFKVFAWGFAKQGPDGSFQGTSDPFHSTSFFLEAAARALLLLQETHDPQYQTLIDTYTPKVHAAAIWMTGPKVSRVGQARNKRFTHRRYAVAAALALSGEISSDQSLAKAALPYIQDGLSLQSPEGYNPEKGGYDVNYNAAGLVYAEHYYTTLNYGHDALLMKRLQQMLIASLNWEETKVLDSGDIDTTGSLRVGHEKNRIGRVKTTAYGPIARAFLFGAEITGDPSYREIARRIVHFRWKI